VQALARGGEGGVDDLEGGLPAAKSGEGEVVDAAGVTIEDVREGGRAPGAGIPDQVGVFHMSSLRGGIASAVAADL